MKKHFMLFIHGFWMTVGDKVRGGGGEGVLAALGGCSL